MFTLIKRNGNKQNACSVPNPISKDEFQDYEIKDYSCYQVWPIWIACINDVLSIQLPKCCIYSSHLTKSSYKYLHQSPLNPRMKLEGLMSFRSSVNKQYAKLEVEIFSTSSRRHRTGVEWYFYLIENRRLVAIFVMRIDTQSPHFEDEDVQPHSVSFSPVRKLFERTSCLCDVSDTRQVERKLL